MKSDKNIRILITGGAGMIGANFANYLTRWEGYEVHILDNLSGGKQEYPSACCKFWLGDITEPKRVNKIFEKNKFHVVFHFAAFAAEALSPFVRNYTFTTNVVGTTNIINACVNTGVKKLIFTSSMAVYGKATPPYTEDQTPDPVDPYGLSKLTSEKDIILANEHFGLNYTIFRPHNVIGKYQNLEDRYRNVLGIWLRSILGEGRNVIKIFGSGDQVRAFSDVQFLLPMFKDAIFESVSNKKIYNIGSDRFYKINEAAEIMKRTAEKRGYTVPIKHIEERKEVFHAYSSHNKIKKEMGFIDNTDLEKSIDEMFGWAAGNSKRFRVKNQKYEIERGIYQSWKK